MASIWSRPQCVNPSSADYRACMGPDFTHHRACICPRTSRTVLCHVLATNLDTFCTNFLRLSMISITVCWPDDVIQNGWRDLTEPRKSLYLDNCCRKWLDESLLIFLTHWSRDKMDAISQTTLSKAFSWMKMFEFRLTFHWSLFLRA